MYMTQQTTLRQIVGSLTAREFTGLVAQVGGFSATGAASGSVQVGDRQILLTADNISLLRLYINEKAAQIDADYQPRPLTNYVPPKEVIPVAGC